MAIGPPIKRRQLFILAAMAATVLATASLIIFYSGKFASAGAAQEKPLQ
ncbi:MAG: hypothetical protein M3239_02055 [Thermoproteota archaeon]|nr:hypothetical protein [Thermoproteota archaeon]